MTTTTKINRCSASSRSFPIPEGVDLRSQRIVDCPDCGRKVHVVRWNSVKQTMIVGIHGQVK